VSLLGAGLMLSVPSTTWGAGDGHTKSKKHRRGHPKVRDRKTHHREPPSETATTSSDAAKEPTAETSEVRIAVPAPAPTPTLAANTVELGEEAKPARQHLTQLEIVVGSRIFSRSLSYRDDLFHMLRPYDLGAAAAVLVTADWFPWASASRALSPFGLTATFEQALGLSSLGPDGTQYPTTAAFYSGGVKVRLPIGGSELSGTAAYGVHRFAIEASNSSQPKPQIPDVDYHFVRIGAASRIGLGSRFCVGLEAAYLHILDTGEIASASYFPRATVIGVEGEAFLGWELFEGWQLRSSFDVRRYAYAMNPQPGDPMIAGGAVDQYLSASFAIAYRMR
jgi:hypothetical protein